MHCYGCLLLRTYNRFDNLSFLYYLMKKIIAGVDEVGRGSLIGPVYAAAVILNNGINKKKLKDSKKISKSNREVLEKYIKKNSYWAIGSASKIEIEKINILNASLLAMKRAVRKLKIKPTLVLIDGNRVPEMKNYKLKSIIKGDQKISEISAASIIAKVSRDRFVTNLSKNFKKYNWAKNAGYGTKDHMLAIKEYGITKFHRKTFKPIHNILSLNKSK